MSKSGLEKHQPAAFAISDQLATIATLAEVVIDQRAYEGSDPAPQLNNAQIEALTNAIRMIGDTTHRQFCQLMKDLGV